MIDLLGKQYSHGFINRKNVSFKQPIPIVIEESELDEIRRLLLQDLAKAGKNNDLDSHRRQERKIKELKSLYHIMHKKSTSAKILKHLVKKGRKVCLPQKASQIKPPSSNSA